MLHTPALLNGLLSATLILASVASLHAADWPEGSKIAEGSTSPDGRYGILLPARPEDDSFEEFDMINALVDLKSHHQLGVIEGAHYFPGRNHRGLSTMWAADSSWCVVTYEGRYGFDTITAVEPKEKSCKQSDLGQHIQKSLDAVIARQAGNKDTGGFGVAYFRGGAGREILVRATAFTNPKALEDQPTYCALFLGSFDLATGKWTRSEARKIVSGEDDALGAAFGGALNEKITFNDEESRLKWHDDRLNDIYKAVRLLLPPERFAKVKKEQIAWLKQLEASDTIDKKCKAMGARIKELQALVW